MSPGEKESIDQILVLKNNHVIKYGNNPFYNNRWRVQYQQQQVHDKLGIDIVINHKTHGEDFTIPSLHIRRGECKGTESKNLKITKNLGNIIFDKQNDSLRRQELYEYDSLIYSIFSKNGLIILSMIIIGMENMKKYIHL
jgi:hypothetical protein